MLSKLTDCFIYNCHMFKSLKLADDCSGSEQSSYFCLRGKLLCRCRNTNLSVTKRQTVMSPLPLQHPSLVCLMSSSGNSRRLLVCDWV